VDALWRVGSGLGCVEVIVEALCCPLANCEGKVGKGGVSNRDSLVLEYDAGEGRLYS
jgi:hypothetical protein